MDDPSLQLQETLYDSIQCALELERPILTHLNTDTSWLVQLPFPYGVWRPPGRLRWNILIDPWFQGPQTDVASWFSKQWHSVDSSVQTVAELNNLLGELEGMMHSHKSDAANRKVYSDYKNSSNPYIDVVVISHEFSDHCHRDTLLELDPKTPIFASRRAAKLIKSWNHFHHVYETPSFSVEESDWRKTSLQPLPNWLGISRIETQSDALYYHSAILIAFNSSSPALTGPSRLSSSTEAIIYAPHGIYAPDLRHLPSAVPPVRTLALLHGLHDIKISVKQLNLGAHNGLQAQRICEARYWVSTHDEIKKGAGLITPFLYRKVLTLREAIEEERSKTGEIQDESSLADVREVTFAELKNGESLLLM